ncbi:MAG: phasin family protein [Pseudomonadota bacterium]
MATASNQATTAASPKSTAKNTASSANASTAEKAKTTNGSSNDLGENAFAFSESAREQYDSLLKSFNENAEQVHDQTQKMMEAAQEGFETAQARFKEVGQEAMDAAQKDMKDAVEFANDLVKTKTVGEALELQRDYWTRFFETRVERTRSMTQSTADAFRDSTQPVSRTISDAMSSTQISNFSTAFFPFPSK